LGLGEWTVAHEKGELAEEVFLGALDGEGLGFREGFGEGLGYAGDGFAFDRWLVVMGHEDPRLGLWVVDVLLTRARARERVEGGR
jgi:hypothetical protein